MITYDTLAKVILSIMPMSNKKLQKISYFSHIWYYYYHKKFLTDISFEAWVHGPVCPDLYNKYRVYGWNTITYDNTALLAVNDEYYSFINNILNYYGSFSADYLEKLTHKGVAWNNARKDLKPYQSSNRIININDSMIDCENDISFKDYNNSL